MLLLWGTASAQTSGGSTSKHKKSSTARVRHISTYSTSSKRKSHRIRRASRHGQQKIDATRAREIQEALIREHYLDGDPTGVWDAKSQSAMQRYQADNGWQTKSIPDSRALIKMGLGPNHDHLLNPETAMTSEPEALRPTPVSDQSAMGTRK